MAGELVALAEPKLRRGEERGSALAVRL